MSVRYGRKDCIHVWRYRSDGWEEGCGPAICVECGAFGCFCDVPEPKPPKKVFFGDKEVGKANINGKWDNPYVRRSEAARKAANARWNKPS